MAVILCFFFIQRALLPFVLLSSSIAIFFFSPCQCQHVSATILSQNNNNVSDGSSLLGFKSAISVDPHGVFSGWNDSVHFCKWRGITCGGRRHPDRVVALRLPLLDLVGTISPALANLTFLRSVNLSSNHFNGQIPSQLANLSRLESLDLSTNSLEGYIPSEFGSLPSLISLRFIENTLTGQIPPTLANVSSLVTLALSSNNLSGVIPSSLAKLPNLSYLDLGFNNLEGAIPPSLWNLSSLTHLGIHYNGLYGSLPQDIGNSLPKLQYLGVHDNNLDGEIPLSLANVSQLSILVLCTNKFSGTIPPNLGKLQYLTILALYENQLEAREPNDWRFIASLSNCTVLTGLWLFDNNLGGQLPKSLANLSRTILNLDMRDNYISGSIPQDIGNLVGLTYLNLGQNSLTGLIPKSFALLNNLRDVYLTNNSLSGEIPRDIGNLTQLELLWLRYNGLNGSIPTSLGNCKLLGSLHLGYNMLTGTIPKEVVSIYTLHKLSLSNNLLEGSIPSEVGSLINLNMLVVSSNKLSGEIPSTFGNCESLVNLYLEGNLFEGSIPTSVSALRGLQELDLSRNNLSGEVPVFFENFRFLYVLNLSFNNFEGELPTKGVFANISAVSVLGNYKLCGGNSMLHLQTCQISAPEKKHKYSKIAITISVASAFLFLLFVFVIVCYWMQKKSRRKPITNNDVGDQYINVSYTDLVKATNRFSEDNLVGSGTFGSVYRGKLDNPEYSTRDVAVKVFNVQQREALKSFMVECNAFRDIRHRNLIKIITACSSIDFRGNDFKALVFEFKANGSLEGWLHPEENDHEIKKLSLIQRMNIIVDVASALEYLHHHGQTPIIHCDLKPSNILLDDDMMALVSDFGIVKYMHKSMTNSTSCSSGIKGTIGYIPPEYGMANKVSTHGDVYSFGILLLELFTGKRPTDDIFREGLSLRSFVEIALPKKTMNVIDVHILQEDIDEPSKLSQSVNNTRSLEYVTSILVIGLSCTKDLPIDRMEMKNVTNELKAIRNRFLEN